MQLADVEDETNGLLTYDRRVLTMPGQAVRGAIGQLRLLGYLTPRRSRLTGFRPKGASWRPM